MIEVKFDKKSYRVPEKWDELSGKQVERIALIFYSKEFSAYLKECRNPTDPSPEGMITGYVFKIKLLWILLGIRDWGLGIGGWWLGYLLRYKVDDGQMADLVKLTDFLFGENKLLKCPVKSITNYELRITGLTIPVGRRYYGPEDELGNLSFGEFVFADDSFMKIMGDEEWEMYDDLNELVAVLYRKKSGQYDPKSVSFNGDIREEFNKNLIDDRAEVVAHWSLGKRLAVLLWYQGCRKNICGRFPHIFTKKEGQNFGWFGVLAELSDNKPYLLEQTARTPMMDVLAMLEKLSVQRVKSEK